MKENTECQLWKRRERHGTLRLRLHCVLHSALSLRPSFPPSPRSSLISRAITSSIAEIGPTAYQYNWVPGCRVFMNQQEEIRVRGMTTRSVICELRESCWELGTWDEGESWVRIVIASRRVLVECITRCWWTGPESQLHDHPKFGSNPLNFFLPTCRYVSGDAGQ